MEYAKQCQRQPYYASSTFQPFVFSLFMQRRPIALPESENQGRRNI
jgi:hypothetical protein